MMALFHLGADVPPPLWHAAAVILTVIKASQRSQPSIPSPCETCPRWPQRREMKACAVSEPIAHEPIAHEQRCRKGVCPLPTRCISQHACACT